MQAAQRQLLWAMQWNLEAMSMYIYLQTLGNKEFYILQNYLFTNNTLAAIGS